MHATLSNRRLATGSSGTRQWCIATKYYEADVDVHVLPSLEWHAPGELTASALTGAEALVVVLDATSPESFAAASAWGEKAGDAGIGTLICVTNKVDIVTGVVPGAEDDGAADGEAAAAISAPSAAPLAEHVAFIQRVSHWCLDAGFEHVQAAATSPLAGGSGRDKSGVPRVLEALECTMWNSMRRRQQQQQPAAEASATDNAAVAAAADDSDSAGDADNGSAAASSSTSSSAAAAPSMQAAVGAEKASSSSKDDGDKASSIMRELLRGSKGTATRGDDSDADVDEDEEDDTSIEKLMAEMQRVRDAARGPGMTDAQRREAAARVAMQLLSLMGGAEGEDDEDEDVEGQ